MSVSKEEYGKMAKDYSPKSPVLTDCIKAFLSGGTICAFGQGLTMIFMNMGIKEDESRLISMVIIIAITAILTAVGVFDNIAKHAGAGTMVPITGFANSIVSPAMEFKREGYILGVGAKLFSIAGPVLVYGISASVAVGVIYYVLLALGWCGV